MAGGAVVLFDLVIQLGDAVAGGEENVAAVRFSGGDQIGVCQGDQHWEVIQGRGARYLGVVDRDGVASTPGAAGAVPGRST